MTTFLKMGEYTFLLQGYFCTDFKKLCNARHVTGEELFCSLKFASG